MAGGTAHAKAAQTGSCRTRQQNGAHSLEAHGLGRDIQRKSRPGLDGMRYMKGEPAPPPVRIGRIWRDHGQDGRSSPGGRRRRALSVRRRHGEYRSKLRPRGQPMPRSGQYRGIHRGGSVLPAACHRDRSIRQIDLSDTRFSSSAASSFRSL